MFTLLYLCRTEHFCVPQYKCCICTDCEEQVFGGSSQFLGSWKFRNVFESRSAVLREINLGSQILCTSLCAHFIEQYAVHNFILLAIIDFLKL